MEEFDAKKEALLKAMKPKKDEETKLIPPIF